LNSAAGSIYQLARQALHGTIPNHLCGREEEQQTLINFLDESLARKKSCSLYISGAPGTGKTACLMKTLETPKVSIL